MDAFSSSSGEKEIIGFTYEKQENLLSSEDEQVAELTSGWEKGTTKIKQTNTKPPRQAKAKLALPPQKKEE